MFKENILKSDTFKKQFLRKKKEKTSKTFLLIWDIKNIVIKHNLYHFIAYKQHGFELNYMYIYVYKENPQKKQKLNTKDWFYENFNLRI